MAKRAQIASLAISMGGAKRLYLRRAEHLEQRSIALRRRPGDIERPDEEEDEKGKRRGKVRQEQVERGEIERPEEDADRMGKMKRDRTAEKETD